MAKINSKMLSMQQAIMDYVRRNLPKDKNNAVTGVVRGGKVIIKNKSYPYVPTVDVYFGDGDYVYCILPDSGNVAAIVGVV